MVYTTNNIKEFGELDIHDYELLNIQVDYFEKSLGLVVKSSKGQEYQIQLEKFYYLVVEGYEPWGQGFYIHDLEIKTNLDLPSEGFDHEGIFGIEILINSGDKVAFYCKEIDFKEVTKV